MIIRSKSDVISEVEDFYPQFGRVLSNGNLRVPWSGVGSDGEKVDGSFEVAPEYPEYSQWRAIINAANN